MRMSLAFVFVASLAACGGNGASSSYSLEASRDCLGGLGETSDSLDFIAESASGGATRLVIDGKEAMVIFAADADEAEDLVSSYESVPGTGDTRRNGNAVFAWTDDPSDEEAQAVEDCLS